MATGTNEWLSHRGRHRVTDLLAATTIGVYLLILLGGTAAVTNASAACPTWPTCHGRLFVPLRRTDAVIALAHRALALLVGIALAGVVGLAHLERVDDWSRRALDAALLLYPIEVAIGALTVGTSTASLFPSAHLLVAIVIFTAQLGALARLLEIETGDGWSDDPSRTKGVDAQAGDDAADSTNSGLLARSKAYLRLTKPRLMWLLCLVAFAAMLLAGGRTVDPGTIAATLGGGVLAVGASGTFNNVLERDTDAEMARTADRPLVQGAIPLWNAVLFGLALTAASAAVFLWFTNVLAAVLGMLAILFYSVVYTVVLKPHTDQNIVVGGAVGAFPALIGWAAVRGTVGLPAVVLGGIVFLWTPAHFYNLALLYRDDYARADFPMLPIVRGETTTLRHVLRYLGATMLGVAALGAMTPLGLLYALGAVVAGAGFLWAVLGLYRQRSDAAAVRAFTAANAYLGVLLLVICVDAAVFV